MRAVPGAILFVSGAYGRFRGVPLGLFALIGIALALRLPGIEYGLPYATLLNPDEQNLVPRAWRVVHDGAFDPDWFDYPSLVIYLFAPLQAWHDAPHVLSARAVVAVLGVATVAATWWLGRAAYGRVAAFVAASIVAVETTSVLYSHAAVTDVPMTLGIAVSLALMLRGKLEWAGAAAGLAISAKYPAVFLAVPLLVAGWRQWRRLALAAGAVAAAFAATSPFVVAQPAQAWDDASRVQRLAREGWLGFEDEGFAGFAFLDRLWEGMGPALVVAVAGVVLALRRRTQADLALALFVVAYYASLLTLDAHFSRYVLPIVPALAVLAGRQRLLAPVTLLLLAVPLAWSVADVARLTRTDTRVVALPEIERLVPDDATVAVESSAPPVTAARVLRLRLPGPAFPSDPNRDLGRLRMHGVDYVLVTGAVADRVLAAREHYLREARFYDELRARANRVYHVQPGGGLTGPWVSLYAL